MEGVGARLGRSSTRYGPATVFNGPVRKWKKKWVHVSPSSSTNTTTTTNHSHNATACTFTNNASHLKLYKWTPISHSADKESSKDDAAAPLEEPPRRKFKYIPIAVLEEQRNEDAENEAVEKAEEEANKLINSHQKDAMEEKPDINDVPMDDNEDEDDKQLLRQDLNESTLDLSLGLNGHDGDSESKADHTRDGQW